MDPKRRPYAPHLPVFHSSSFSSTAYILSLPPFKNHTHYSYAVLGLEVGSTIAQVKQRWKLMVKYYHSDKNVGYEDARYVFGRVQEAYHKIKGVDDTERNNLE